MPDNDTLQLQTETSPSKDGLLLVLSENLDLYKTLQSILPDYDVRTVHAAEQVIERQEPVAALVDEPTEGPIIVLVDWSLDAAAGWLTEWRTAPFPVFAFCEGPVANRVAALMAGADATIEPPISPALIHALRVAYYRKRPLDHLRATDRREQDAGAEGVKLIGISSPADCGDGAGAFSGVEAGDFVRAGAMLLDRVSRRLWIEGHLQKFSPRPFDLLLYLIERTRVCCTREEILRDVWEIEFDPTTNVVDVQVCALRNLLRPHGLDGTIRTERGKGYFFDPLI